ncbi:hypothetical protein, partial [Streptoalloteichus tenebrarius]|uniref:hypothetical protein n=1 Tax=Streptoalloteichus tenebrarius (strain ATCC 17920 / DSM 40477 / JCM 4838 / CBS 697.72 / NBRC 16177 / NCIMB 11028 / NRRL B-12390 / A12253. 1 / ISP 5477) TaxID=1933 RepID=UPI0020A2BB63
MTHRSARGPIGVSNHLSSPRIVAPGEQVAAGPGGTSGYRGAGSGFRFPVSGFRFPVSGFRFPVSGFRFPVSGFR